MSKMPLQESSQFIFEGRTYFHFTFSLPDLLMES